MKSKLLGIVLLLLSIFLSIAFSEIIKKYRETYMSQTDLPENLRSQQTQFYNNRQ